LVEPRLRQIQRLFRRGEVRLHKEDRSPLPFCWYAFARSVADLTCKPLRSQTLPALFGLMLCELPTIGESFASSVLWKEIDKMKIRTMILVGAATLGLGATYATAQVGLWDIVHVTLPYSVIVGKTTLAPGAYTIEQLHSDASTILLFYNGDGMKFKTSTMTLKAYDPNTPSQTEVVLERVDDNYYFDKMWIQGKVYGYEFPLPKGVKEEAKEESLVTIPANTSTTPTAPENPQPPVATLPAPPAVPAVTAPPEPAQVQEPQIQEPQEPQTQPPTTTETPESSMPPTTSANRAKQPATDQSTEAPAMPSTSAGWLAMLLSGGALSGAGMLLRRKG
jgi:hypothetical protein